MSKVVLDTDILSEIYNGVNQTVLFRARQYLIDYPQLSFTSITVHEVLFGLHVKTANKQIERFFQLINPHEELVPTAADFRLAAEIRAILQRSGTPIGIADPIIAACALNRELPLVTGNTRHYGFVQSAGFNLQLINWRQNVTS